MKYLALFVILTLLLSGCDRIQSNRDSENIKIVTTLYPLYDFARAVGGEKVDVYLLLPPGVEAHSFEPTPRDMVLLSEADMFIYIGAGMEPWAEDILKGIDTKNMILIDSSSVSDLIDSEHSEEEEHEHNYGAIDPHLWLDFSNDMKIVKEIERELSEKFPEYESYFRNNSEFYIEKLQELDNSYSASLDSCEENTIITGGHQAYSYLGRRYGLELISIFGISPNSEPSPKTLMEISDIIEDKGIKYMFYETMVNPKVSEVLSKDAGVKLLVLNPGHNVGRNEIGKDFITIMEENLVSLKTGLSCN